MGMQMRKKDMIIKRCLSISICIIVLVIPIVLTGKMERQIVQNNDNSVIEVPKEQVVQNIDNSVIKEPEEDSRIIQVDKSKNGVCEKCTYKRSDGAEDELLKSFYKTRTDDGVSVRIVSYCNGEEKVLTDCEYSTVQFPYYFERYFNAADADDIFNRFYEDDFVWEKTIYAEEISKEYILYYAQEIRYDSVDKEKVTGYEGHLWVTDEDTRIVKRLFWQSEAPYAKITWEESVISIQYADGSDKTCTLEEILKDPAEAVCEKSMQIDYSVKEYAIDTEKVDARTDEIYKDAYYRALSGQDMVRTLEGEEVYLKEYWFFQGDSDMEMPDEVFLENLIENTKFYYMDFDDDGLPELVTDIIGDGLHILKYLPDEEIVEIFFGYERMPYYNLLGSGQLYYQNPTLANKDMWRYDIVDADGQEHPVVYFEENTDYKSHKEDENEWWDMAYFVYLDEELGMVQVDEKRYQEITGKFFDAVEHAVAEMTFEEVFGENR